MTQRQAKKDSKAVDKRLTGRLGKSKRQARKDSKAGEKRIAARLEKASKAG